MRSRRMLSRSPQAPERHGLDTAGEPTSHHGHRPDATIAGPPTPIMGLLLGLLELSDARAKGISYQGDDAILDRIGAETNLTASPS